jgi:uncharacterized protein YdeI (YjbR/CyaY-like superfamily)
VTGDRIEIDIPDELRDAFEQAPEAGAKFAALPPSHRREYVEWVQSGRREDTRQRRAAQTVMRLLDQ